MQCFLIESTAIEMATVPYKTDPAEVFVKTNRMRSTRWTYHERWCFASNYFIFLKMLFTNCAPATQSIVYQLPKSSCP